jgi:hypothetical protein
MPTPGAFLDMRSMARRAADRDVRRNSSRPDQFFKELERFLESFLSKIISRV